MFLKIERLNELISQDNTHPEDVERKALFLIISGNDELWNLRSQIYDFKDRSIKFELLDSGICTSSKNLLSLAFNLYNNNPMNTLLDTFCYFDNLNFELAITAIQLRFGKTPYLNL